MQTFDAPDLQAWYDPTVFSTDADRWLAQLHTALDWQHYHIRLFGRLIASPRLTCWVADSGISYRYSGLEFTGTGWPPILSTIRTAVEDATQQQFNSVLANWYRDGNDSMGWHSDDEPELSSDPAIASLTLGCARRFSMKHKTRKDLKRIDCELTHGSLLFMHGPTQHHWLHCIPKTKRAITDRINLTFRLIKSQRG